jgi:hypothetical protein
MKLTPEKLTAFLAVLADTCQVRKACAAIDVSAYTAYKWRKELPEFAEAWEDAMRAGVMNLESEAHRRAFEGTDKPLVHQGQFTYLRDFAAVDPETGERYLPEQAPIMRNADGSPRIATMKEYSDTLAIFLLKAHDPDKYRERSSVDVGNANDKPFLVEDSARVDKLGGLLKAVALRVGVENTDLL